VEVQKVSSAVAGRKVEVHNYCDVGTRVKPPQLYRYGVVWCGAVQGKGRGGSPLTPVVLLERISNLYIVQ